MYDILKKETIEPFSKIKWGRHFNITDLQWKKYYNIPFQCTKSSKLHTMAAISDKSTYCNDKKNSL